MAKINKNIVLDCQSNKGKREEKIIIKRYIRRKLVFFKTWHKIKSKKIPATEDVPSTIPITDSVNPFLVIKIGAAKDSMPSKIVQKKDITATIIIGLFSNDLNCKIPAKREVKGIKKFIATIQTV